MDRLWRIELFGGVQLVRADGVTTRLATRKVASLLAYLAYFSGRAHSRDVLAELLWPEADFDAQRNSFRVALNSLRKQLEPPGITGGAVLVADRSQIRLHPDAFSTDVAAFEAAACEAGRFEEGALGRAALERAVALYRAPLLTGWYDDWIDAERSRLADLYARVLRQLTNVLWNAGERDGALAATRSALQADPLDEEAYRLRLRLLARAGRLADAQREYEALTELLRAELGRAPSPLTRELMRSLPPPDPAPAETIAIDARPSPAPLPAPAPASPAPVGYVPVLLTRFFGRSAEIAALAERLAPDARERDRLITLVGPGGVGKTRLALAVAAAVRDAYAGRVWFVALADVDDPAQLAAALAAALRLPAAAAQQDPLDGVRATLGDGPTLLVLDNLEQLSEAAGDLLQDLLTELPGLACLVTSRRELEVPGERSESLAPLPAPERDDLALEELLAAPSVALFLDRVQALRPDFQLTPRNAASIAALCRRLDGWPLALELVAGWAWTLTPAQMVSRLESRFEILVTGQRRVPDRQRSLMVVLDAAMELLSDDGRSGFARLSVFRGSFSTDAARAVVGDEVEQTLASLRRQALLVVASDESETRFTLLETVRAYADTRLTGADRAVVRARHAHYFAGLAAALRPLLDGSCATEALARLDADRDNCMAALRGALDTGDDETALTLGGALWPYWYRRGLADEGAALLLRALSRGGAPALRAPACLGAGRLLNAQNRSSEALALLSESLTRFRSVGEKAAAAEAALNLALAAREADDRWTARAALETFASLRAEDDPWAAEWARGEVARLGPNASRSEQPEGEIAELFLNLGFVAAEQGDLTAGRALLAEALVEAQAPALMLAIQERVARVALRQGDALSARRALEEALALSRRQGSVQIGARLANLAPRITEL